MIAAEVRLQSPGERMRGEEIEGVNPDPSKEKVDREGSKRRWWQEEGKIGQTENSEKPPLLLNLKTK